MGNAHNDSHPYSCLANRVHQTGWDKIQSRRFASDLSVVGALETIEYTLFSNNRAIVVLSRMPYSHGKDVHCISEILFFVFVGQKDIPPQSPNIMLKMYDQSSCTECKKNICDCQNTIIRDQTQRPCIPDSGNGERLFLSWEDRARLVSQGKRSGYLTIIYSSCDVRKVPQIIVRQAYTSVVESNEVVSFRIRTHYSKNRLNFPMLHLHNPLIHLLHTDDSNFSKLKSSYASQSPPSQKWSDIPNLRYAQKSCSKLLPQPPPCITDTNSCLKILSRTRDCNELPSKKARTFEKNLSLFCGSSSLEVSRSGIAGESSASLPSIGTGDDSFVRDKCFHSSVLDLENRAKGCDNSTGQTKHPTLAFILNSRKDGGESSSLTNTSNTAAPFIASAARNIRKGYPPVMQIEPSENLTSVVACPKEEKERSTGDIIGGLCVKSKNTETMHCGILPMISSPLPLPSPPPRHSPLMVPPLFPPLAPQIEPLNNLLKKSTTEPLSSLDHSGFHIESTCADGVDGRERALSLSPWNRPGMQGRPMSVLCRALNVARSSSPFPKTRSCENGTLAPSLPSAICGIPRDLPTKSYLDFPKGVEKLNHRSNQKEVISRHSQGIAVKGARHQSLAEVKELKRESIGIRDSEIRKDIYENGMCCEICGAKFAKRSNKLRHIHTVHNRLKQFACDVCGTKFGLKADLGRHRFRIHESRSFRCERCGKSYAEHDQLKYHIRVTHEEDSRPWECWICKIRFGRKSSLTRHVQTVHQQTRFVCRICNKTYSQKFDAIRHERRVHGLNEKVGRLSVKQGGE